MSVLLVGTVPPPGGAEARVLGRLAASLASGGESVEVASPDFTSASHRHARLSGPRLALRLAIWSRRHDRLVLRIEPGLPLRADAGRLERAVVVLCLGLALSRFREVTLRLDSPVPVPGGLGGRAMAGVWRRATAIVVMNEADRAGLLAAEGVDPASVLVEAPPAHERSPEREAWALGDDATREEILAVVRERAARDRSLAGAHRVLEEAAGGRTAAAPRPRAVPLAGLTAVAASVMSAARSGRLPASVARRLGAPRIDRSSGTGTPGAGTPGDRGQTAKSPPEKSGDSST